MHDQLYEMHSPTSTSAQRQLAESISTTLQAGEGIKRQPKYPPSHPHYTPTSYTAATKCAQWARWTYGQGIPGNIGACGREDQSWIDHKVYERFLRSMVPDDELIIPTFRIFKRKTNRTVPEKSRTVANGSFMNSDWKDRYSPTVRNLTCRIFFALAAYYGLHITGGDLETSFLQCPVPKKPDGTPRYYYLEYPPGFYEDGQEVDRKTYVMRCSKMVYGLDTSSKALYERMNSELTRQGFSRSSHDSSLYWRIQDGHWSLAILYVDDCCVASTSRKVSEEVFREMRRGSDTTEPIVVSIDPNPVDFLGYSIKYYKNGISLDANEYTKKLVAKYDPDGKLKAKSLPGDCTVSGIKLEEESMKAHSFNKKQKKLARTITGELLYEAGKNSPEICPAVCRISRLAHRPTKLWWNACIHTIAYLKGKLTRSPCVFFHKKRPEDPLCIRFTGLADAGFCQTVDGRSMLGYVIMANNSLVGHRTAISKTITLSTTESEAMALSALTKELLYIIQLLAEIGIDITPISLGEDNRGCLLNSLGGGGKHTRHISYRINHVRSVIVDGLCNIEHVPSECNTADLMSKIISKPNLFNDLLKHLLHFQTE